ncbi:MAG: glycosyltransferase family 2 protein [Chloroflexi bacterium]|nr:glycosyltransferase family 2 protein [Chloroflexota bacterium]
MSDSAPAPLLSIIIPAYNEEARLAHSLEDVARYVADHHESIEVIVVNNNSTDQTAHIAEEFASELPYMRVLHEPRQGKGAAVRTGMLAGRGDYLIFCDADFSMPVEEVDKFIRPELNGYDIAIGSRELANSVRIDEPEYRHLMGRVFNFIVRVLAVPGIQDTQCGFKAFRRDVVQQLFPMQTIDGWGFDVEILYLGRKHGYHIHEVPITWYYKEQSRVHPIRDSFNMLMEVLKVRFNDLQGRYSPEHW